MKTLITILFLTTVSFGQTVQNTFELTNYSATESVNMLGYHNPNDGGGGLFYLVDDSISGNIDNGIVFNSIVSGKNWVRNIITDQINVKWFGAKGDGFQIDHPFINSAVNYIRNNKGNTLYIPSGNYVYGTNGATNLTNLDEGLKIQGNGSNSIISGGANGNGIFKIYGNNIEIKNLSIIATTWINGITIENNAKNISLDNIYFRGNFYHAILLYECSDIKILNSTFDRVLGYQIIQQWHKASSNVLVHGNTSMNCKNDFIELNSEKNNPSKNWVITNNNVKNINGGTIESRFIGITATDGVVISNNIFEKCTGDAAFHFEGITGDLVITNNVIRDPSGEFGSLIANYDNNQSVRAKRYINFSNNLVEFSETYTTSGADRIIYSSQWDETVFNITNNKFVNNSSKDLNVLHKSDSETHWNFIGNEIRGFNSAISIGQNAGLININNNTFVDTKFAIKLGSNSTIKKNSLNIKNNSFENVENVFDSVEGEINLLSFSSNVFDNSNLDFGLEASFLRNFKSNIFKNSSSTNYRDSQISLDIPNNITKNIFSIEKQNYTYLCWVEIQASGASDRTRHLLRVSRNLIWGSNFNNHISILDQTRNGNYPLPIFNVNQNGLNVIITGASGSNFKAKVSIIDINGLLILDEESLGRKLTTTSASIKESISENTNPLVFENSVSFDEFSKLYPNPAKDEFYIQTDQIAIINDLSIYDLNGRLVKKFNNINSSQSISVADLSIGTYLVIIHSNNKREIRKIIKK